MTYSYDHGDNVRHIEGTKPNQPLSVYVDVIHYDRFEQRTYQLDGNGVETHYQYDLTNRRLNHLYDNSTQIGQLLQDNTYKHDNVGNIISIDDNGLNARNQYFEYDNINRLIYSNGGMNCQGTGIGYETDYAYSAAGRISMLDDINHGQEKEVYFYHSDHLGSASWITDFSGVAVQHIQYLPYGEPYINQHPFGYSERFTFTGKEKDEKTGYGYFGARYMDHELMTMWLSVDPMSDKYPSISPYAYCNWNPVRLIDPDGREVWVVGDNGEKYKYKNGRLYQMDGNLYKGNDKFANGVCKDLRKLEKKGLKTEIKEMASDDNKHIVIHSSDKGNWTKADNATLETNGEGCGSKIGYNPNLRKNNDGKRKPYVGLAHELGHAYNSFCEDVNNTELPVEKYLGRTDNGDGTYRDSYQPGLIKMNEIYAVRFENKVRGKNNQRVTYDGYYIGKYL